MRERTSGAASAGSAASALARPRARHPRPAPQVPFSVFSIPDISPRAELGGSRCVSPLELTRYPRSSTTVLLDSAMLDDLYKPNTEAQPCTHGGPCPHGWCHSSSYLRGSTTSM